MKFWGQGIIYPTFLAPMQSGRRSALKTLEVIHSCNLFLNIEIFSLPCWFSMKERVFLQLLSNCYSNSSCQYGQVNWSESAFCFPDLIKRSINTPAPLCLSEWFLRHVLHKLSEDPQWDGAPVIHSSNSSINASCIGLPLFFLTSPLLFRGS